MSEPVCEKPVTLDELLGRCMGELEFARNILQSFLDSCPEQLEQIQAELQHGDSTGLAQKVHRLKGTAATVAARPLRKSLEQLEAEVRNGKETDPASLQHLLNAAFAEYEKVDQYVQSELL